LIRSYQSKKISTGLLLSLSLTETFRSQTRTVLLILKCIGTMLNLPYDRKGSVHSRLKLLFQSVNFSLSAVIAFKLFKYILKVKQKLCCTAPDLLFYHDVCLSVLLQK